MLELGKYCRMKQQCACRFISYASFYLTCRKVQLYWSHKGSTNGIWLYTRQYTGGNPCCGVTFLQHCIYCFACALSAKVCSISHSLPYVLSKHEIGHVLFVAVICLQFDKIQDKVCWTMSGTVPGHNEVHSNWAPQTQEPPHKRAVPPVVALHPISGGGRVVKGGLQWCLANKTCHQYFHNKRWWQIMHT